MMAKQLNVGRMGSSKLGGRLALVLTAVLGFAGLVGATGCDETGMGMDGFVPDWETAQSVNDYRQDVYDNANAAWDDYIREKHK